MFWWKRQSNIKKVFYAGSVMCLAAGISAGREAMIGGVMLSIMFLVVALVLPNKGKSQTPEEKKWKYLITPHISSKDKIYRNIFSIIALLFFFVSVYLLFSALLEQSYALAIIYAMVMFAALSSWVYLHPAVYNDFFMRTKIIPLQRPIKLKKLFEEVSSIRTPYGCPLMGIIPDVKEPVAVYRIIDLNWVVFFYIRNDDIIIDSRYLGTKELNPEEVDWVLVFIQQLADMFSFIENTGEVPDDEDIVRIFKTEGRNY